MLKTLLAICLFFSVSNCMAQAPPEQPEVRDTVQMEFVRCPLADSLRCKRVKGYGILRRSAAAITCSNPTGTEVVDMQIYLDELKKVIDRTKYDIFFK